MSLRTKLLAILVAIGLLYVVMDAAVQRWVILPGFHALEAQEAEEDMDRCLGIIQHEIDTLERFCLDWSSWDDMYRYAAQPDQAFVDSNLIFDWGREGNFDILYILDEQGTVLWGRAYDKQERADLVVGELPKTPWSATHPLLAAARKAGGAKGLFQTDKGLVLLAARQILTNNNEGPARGVLVMGRFFDATVVARISKLTRLELRVWPMQAGDLPEREASLAKRISDEAPYAFVARDRDVLNVCAIVPDILGKPALFVEADTVRDIIDRGEGVLFYTLFSIIVIGMVLLLVILMAARVAVLDPVAALTRHVSGVGRQDDLELLDLPGRHDEIGVLAREFNLMVRRLQSDRAERQRAEDALRISERRLRSVVEAAPDGIIVADAQGSIESLNHVAENLFGYATDEAEALRLSDLMPSLCPGANDIPSTGQDTDGRRKDGSTFPLHWTVSEVSLDDRKLYTGVVHDLTEMRAMQDSLLRAQHMATVGEMGASVAHEIRNPLAGISGALQVLRDLFSGDAERRALMDEVLSQVTRVEGIVRRLLLCARHWTPVRQKVDLRALVARVVQDAKDQEAWRDSTNVFEGAERVEISIDPALVEQILWNLMQNAADAAGVAEGAQGAKRALELCWRFEDRGDGASLVLRDNGPGMSDNVLKGLFQPLFTTKVYGTGLGLVICQRIMEAHGGTISVTSVPGEGTEIVLWFPKSEETQ